LEESHAENVSLARLSSVIREKRAQPDDT